MQHFANAQVTTGIYTNANFTQIGIGSNPENKFFVEGRLSAGDFYVRGFGLEAICQYNFYRSDWYNVSGGLMVGFSEYEETEKYGVPFLLSIKPIQENRKLAILLEATPLLSPTAGYLVVRGNFGVRYTLGKN
ncbi:hypothetical protein [Echinicola sp. 20G]|uniref:hypothetical protein n=1 Tax=Echinicola sp. 20G TaxID=2781961 RepID=UPI0019107807|nr:hypothetical protein [Echinicola sp. 20G]